MITKLRAVLGAVLWNGWCAWNESFFLHRGRFRAALLIKSLVGMHVRVVTGVKLEIFPPSSADNWLLKKMNAETAIHIAINDHLTHGDVFIDVGANIGLFSIYAAKRGANVYSIEPSPREMARLQINSLLNNVRLNTLPFGLGEKTEAVKFSIEHSGNHMMNRVITDAEAPTNTSILHIRRFADIFDSNILSKTRLVKIDVEGYELQVLRGMEDVLNQMKKCAFVIEVTPKWLADRGDSVDMLYAILESRGWKARFGHSSEPQWDEIFDPPN